MAIANGQATSGGGKKKNKKNKNNQKAEEDVAPSVEDIDTQISKIKGDWETEKDAMMKEKE